MLLTVGIIGTGRIGTQVFRDRDIACLRQFKNVVYTQHMAFNTDSAVESMVRCGVEGLVKIQMGETCSTKLC